MKTLKNTALVAAAVLSTNAFADSDLLPHVYGRADVSVQSNEVGSADSVIVESSNSSRFGLQNSHKVNDAISVFYRLEYEVYWDQSKKASDDEDILKARNTIVGVKGDFGSVFVGINDTPVKKVQQKVDQFNDYYLGDIKSLLNGENRVSNTLSYKTPKMGGFEGWVMLLQGEGSDITGDGQADDSLGDAISASVAYATGPVSLALGYDSEVNKTDILRASVQYKQGAFQLGAMVNQSEPANGNVDAETGFLLSGAVNVDKSNVLKAQFTSSDEKRAGGQMISAGWDHYFAKTTKFYAYYTDLSFDDSTNDAKALGVGIQHKFGKDK